MLAARHVKTKKSPKTGRGLERLTSGVFRKLNELLYSQSSDQVKRLIQSDKLPQFAEKYHEGYDQQLAKWPNHPLDFICRRIREIVQLSAPAEKASAANPVIIDMGCGSCRLWRELSKEACVISVDFAPPTNTKVLPKRHNDAADYLKEGGLICASMTSVPLTSHCADVVVFSLSLMGTDWPDFLAEGFRLAKSDGRIYIAEPQSRVGNRHKLARKLKQAGLEVLTCTGYDEDYFLILELRPVPQKQKFDKSPLDPRLLSSSLPARTEKAARQTNEAAVAKPVSKRTQK